MKPGTVVSLWTKARILSYMPQFLLGLYRGRKVSMSFDITDFCNLHCPYCYWWESRKGEELPVEKIVNIAKLYRQMGIVHATWVGGEPMLRPDVLRAVTPLFPINWIVTNGTNIYKTKDPHFDPFALPNTWIIVSLDGVGDAHDTSRNKPGLYEKIKTFYWNKPILTTTILHQGNRNEPAKLLAEWSKSNIVGMTFEFATPIGRAANPKWDLVGKDRDRVIDDLISLKKKYGRFMANSINGLTMQKSQNLTSWVGELRCPTAKYTISFDAQGNIKRPCVLGSSPNNPKGKRPNCSACGCHVPTVLSGIKLLDLQTFDAALWFLRG